MQLKTSTLIWSQKVQLVGRGGQGAADPAVYSFFGQVVYSRRLNMLLLGTVTSPLSRPILCLQSQTLLSELLQVNSESS